LNCKEGLRSLVTGHRKCKKDFAGTNPRFS
jgi:hypothetical protein